MVEQDPGADPHAWLATLQAAGADRVDPVRWAYLQALARRLATRSGRARQLLEQRLQQGVQALQATTVAPAPPVAPPEATRPLQALLARLADSAGAPSVAATPRADAGATAARPPDAAGTVPPPGELKSVRHFRHAWKRLNAEQRLAQSRAALPQNAGPLNSQHLVHKALQQMRQLSPAYFERFVAQVDGLLWLERMLGEGGTPPAPRKGGSR